jgi:TonB family protein
MNRFLLPTALAFNLTIAFPGNHSPAIADDVLANDPAAGDVLAADPVADPGKAEDGETTEEGSEGPPEINRRLEAHNRFLRLNDEERYQEAGIAAQEVVDLTSDEFGPDSMELATPLVNLATMQTRNGPLESAEANYKRCVAIIENYEGLLSKRLINPLIGLGATYNRLGLYEQAVQTYERALRINHVNDGFYNFEQFRIYDGLTESYIGLEEIEDANFYQEAQLEIYQRKVGVNSPATAPGHYKLAEWYERSGQLELAMQTYRKADTVIRTSEAGKTSPDRIRALEGQAHIYERAGNQAAGASAIKRAISVIDANPEIDYRTRGTLLVRLGDLYTRSGKAMSAEETYAEAWGDLSQDDRDLDLRDRFFAQPVRVAGRPLSLLEVAPNAHKASPEDLSTGRVLISYTVQADGQTADIRVVESEPSGLMDKSLVSTFSRSLFRPQRVDGVAMAAENQLFQLDFRYAKDKKSGRESKPQRDPDSESAQEDEKEEAKKGRLSYPE